MHVTVISESKLYKKIEKEILSVHNNYRKVHSAPKLAIDKKMSEEAKEWADTLAKTESLVHNTETKDGENLYMACAPKEKKLKPWKSVVAW